MRETRAVDVRDEPETRGGQLLKRVLAGVAADESPLTHAEHLPPRAGLRVEWPEWVPQTVTAAFGNRGVPAPWQHQAEAAELAHGGSHVVVSTGTGSGKSLAYQLPILSALLTTDRATALYLAPTKALATDQLDTIASLELPGVRAGRYDGDTTAAERDWARAHANWIFSNPDMLHHGILPAHERFARFFRGLRYVVVDECHGYRGLFGSHVALLLRRLLRVAARYESAPVFVLASATAASPADAASRLLGAGCTAVSDDASPRGGRTVALWEPPLEPGLAGEHGAPVRRSAGSEASRLLADLVVEGARTLAFVRSRRGAELSAIQARRLVSDVAPELAGKIASYRGGYLAEDRRALERALLSGELLGVATTNALELGVDVAGLDAVLLAGYPGTLASFWQQAGRAGRGSDDALIVFVAREDPLDTYLARHPEALLRRPLEATVTDPGNPTVLAPQLASAAAELPLTESELPAFGGDVAREILDGLVADGVLRRRPRGWFPKSGSHPHATVNLRGGGGEQVAIVESETARLLGTVDPDAACWQAHPGAVYLHQGESYVVDELDVDAGMALVHPEDPEWTTSPSDVVDISVVRTIECYDHGAGVLACLGEVEVTSQVVGYLRKLPSGEVIDQVPLDLPARSLRTRAVWYTVGAELLSAATSPVATDGSRAPGGACLVSARVPGALHAAEHAAIGLLPLFATCDRWDVGGVSTALHTDTGEATVFVHDGHPGGAGFADRGFAALVPWLAATREAVLACECSTGCPSCVQSPKCGNGNEPLDKAGALAVLDAVLPRLRVPGVRHGHDFSSSPAS